MPVLQDLSDSDASASSQPFSCFPNKNKNHRPKSSSRERRTERKKRPLTKKQRKEGSSGGRRKSLPPRAAHDRCSKRVRQKGSWHHGVMEILRWLRAWQRVDPQKNNCTSCCAFNREISGHQTLGVDDRSPSFGSPNSLFPIRTRRPYPRAHHFAFGQGICLLRLVELLPDPS